MGAIASDDVIEDSGKGETVLNIVDAHGLNEIQLDKKGVMALIKALLKKIEANWSKMERKIESQNLRKELPLWSSQLLVNSMRFRFGAERVSILKEAFALVTPMKVKRNQPFFSSMTL